VEISAQSYSIVPIDRMEVYYNDAAIETAQPTKGGIEGPIHKRIPAGRSGWFILRAITKEGHLSVDDLYAVGEMNPVYVYCGDQPSRARMPSTSCSGRVASRTKREQIEASLAKLALGRRALTRVRSVSAYTDRSVIQMGIATAFPGGDSLLDQFCARREESLRTD
jgi:hypothetical protein